MGFPHHVQAMAHHTHHASTSDAESPLGKEYAHKDPLLHHQSPVSATSSSASLSHPNGSHKVDKDALKKQVHMYASKDPLVAGLKAFLRDKAAACIARTGSFVVGLSGGSLVPLLSSVLIDLIGEDGAKWFCFMVDERYVPETSAESNAGQWLAAGLPTHILHRRTQRDATSSPVALEAAAVAAEDALKWVLEETGKDGPDVALLGMGSDGHVASLFPRHLRDDGQYSRLYASVSDAPTGPPQRLTMTLAALGAAADTVFVVTGPHKAAAVEAVWRKHDRTLPAYAVAKQARHAHWFIDVEAGASLLPYFASPDLAATEAGHRDRYIYQHTNSSSSSLGNEL